MKKLITLCSIIGLMFATNAMADLQGLGEEILPHNSPMPLDGSWIVIDEVVPASGFFTGDWYWNKPYSVTLSITDLFVVTDAFEVYDSGSLVLTTPALADYAALGIGAFDSPPYTSNPDTAWAEPLFSKGLITFAPGYHDITIRAYQIPAGFNDATVAFRAVPVPGAILLGMLGLSVAGVKLRKFA